MVKAWVKNPIISSAISVTSATGTTLIGEVPAGSYVYRVGLMATATVATATLDVGDASTKDRFLDGITDIAVNDIKMSGLGGAVGADPVTGHYYSAQTPIYLNVVATGALGTVKGLIWYTPDPTATN